MSRADRFGVEHNTVEEFIDRIFGSAAGEAVAHPPAPVALRPLPAIACGRLPAAAYRRTRTGDLASAASPRKQVLLAWGAR